MNGWVIFLEILQCGCCIFILSSSCLYCHPCGLPSDDLKKCKNVIHLSAIDKPVLSPSLFYSLKNSPTSALIYPFNLSFLCLQVLWIMCFLTSGSAWKIGQHLCWYLVFGALDHRSWLIYHMWEFAFCIHPLMFLCSWVCSNAGRISIFKHLYLNFPEVLLILYLKLSSLRYACLSCRKIGWIKEVVEYYGDSHCLFLSLISPNRINSNLVILWRFEFSWLVTVDTKINPVSHLALVEMFYCMLQTEKRFYF